MLNVNTVRNSETMFSRRVIEAIACGVPVISSYNTGLYRNFGDCVMLSQNEKETDQLIQTLLSNEFERDKIIKNGIRKVYNHHTTEQRMNFILEKIGINKQVKSPFVSVISVLDSKNGLRKVIENFKTQRYENKELIIIVNNKSIIEKELEVLIGQNKNIIIHKNLKTMPLCECMNLAVDKSHSDILAKFDESALYSPYYIEDNLHAMRYSKASVVGKDKYFSFIENSNEPIILGLTGDNNENSYTKSMIMPSTMFWKKELHENGLNFDETDNSTELSLIRKVLKQNKKVYVTDRFGFIRLQETGDFEGKELFLDQIFI